MHFNTYEYVIRKLSRESAQGMVTVSMEHVYPLDSDKCSFIAIIIVKMNHMVVHVIYAIIFVIK